MAPRPGSIHRVARRDSKAALMWEWAQTQRTPWSTLDLAEHVGGSARRIRETVAAWLAAGLIREIKPSQRQRQRTGRAKLSRATTYEIAWEHRGKPAPVTIRENDRIVGMRVSEMVEPARIQAIRARTGMTLREFARRLGVHERTLVRIIAGEIKIASDDPIIAQLNVLDAVAGEAPAGSSS